VGVLAALAALAVLRPWTVRPLAEAPPASFDPGSYAGQVWDRVLDEARSTAVDVASAHPERYGAAGSPSRGALFVEGRGVVTSVDRESRVGLLRVDVAGVPRGEVAIQIGPVLRGTALRDALSFVCFTDFTNQSEFARVANALNDRVLRSVLAGLDAEALEGRELVFSGAMASGGARSGIEIVPLVLQPVEEGR
jgi:predicted lipoprotein